MAALRDKTLDFGPGEKMSYSNSGYLVLGAIIEKVSGQSYEKFVTDNIFTPLGMNDSGYDSNTAIIKRRASGYIKTPAGYVNAGYIHMSIPHAAGALYSTTGDLLKWEQALFAGKLVSKASLDRMITPFKNDYALGLTSTLDKGRRVIAHGGGIDGFNTHLAYYPETKTVIVALSNVNGPAPGAIAAQLGAMMHGETVTLLGAEGNHAACGDAVEIRRRLRAGAGSGHDHHARGRSPDGAADRAGQAADLPADRDAVLPESRRRAARVRRRWELTGAAPERARQKANRR